MATPIDVLLLQLGTPDAPTARALRPYLRQFLSDPRVLEMPALFRWILVNLIIVPFRSSKSAAKYRRIWSAETGSPLLDITRRQTTALAEALGDDYRVWFAMRYGRPSVRSVIRRMIQRNCRRLVVVPMFPQYSASTTGSGFDAVFDALRPERVIPSVRLISDYHDDPDYLEAVAVGIEAKLKEARERGFPPDLCILSFHGVPIKYILRGDPYQKQSAVTAKLLAKRLRWSKGGWRLTFQSRLGRSKWLLPYTDLTLKELGNRGARNVLVAQPGFTADCLETIDEIGHEAALEFQEAGGQTLIHAPCVNDSPQFIHALQRIVERETEGWR